jgi:hypothetical protein
MRRRILFALAATLALSAAPAYAGAPLHWTAIQRISPSGSPYGGNCSGSTTGTLFLGTEVEPWVATNPADDQNSIAVWQQDRFSNGGSQGLRAAYSDSTGWHEPANQPQFSVCANGTGEEGGYERATDPWVDFSSDGSTAYFMSLSLDQSNDFIHAMTVSRSFDGGATWESKPTVLKRDTNPHVLNDKNSLTADRFNPDYAYAIWDRLVFPNERSKGKSYENAAAYYGPTWFTRTTNGGDSWETARKIWDPAQERGDSGRNDQTIGNQIVQTSATHLADVFTWINNDNAGGNKDGGRKGYKVAVITSDDNGATWSNATVIDHYIPGVVHDPTDGAPLRTGDIIPEVAVDPRPNSNTLYVVWQARTASSPSSVMLSKSTDGGENWSDPEVVNQVTSTQAFTPSVRVDKNGAVVITYYDLRNDTDSAPLWTDYWSITQRPGETDWTEDHISGPFDHSTAAIARGYFLGDYAGLDAGENSDVFRAVFGQATGTTTNRGSDIEESEADEDEGP